MRGRTLNHAFVILDEAQNTTPEQMKMFLTRIGFGAKAVVTGDVSQIDLPRGSGQRPDRRRAGAAPACRGIAITHFTAADVVRHPLVARIVDAYDAARASTSRRASGHRSHALLRCRCSLPTPRHRALLPRHRVQRWLRAPGRAGRDHRAHRRCATRAARSTASTARKDYATNVLTFDYQHASRWWSPTWCCARRWSSARRASRASTWLAHYAHLLVHGALHAQGMDHERAARRQRDGGARDARCWRAGLRRPVRALKSTRASVRSGRLRVPR